MSLIQYRAVIIFFLSIAVSCLAACRADSGEVAGLHPVATEGSSDVDIADSLAATDARTSVPASIYVYVCGCVREPGVYALPQGSRVFEAIEAAGGLTEEAQNAVLNLAAILVDQERVYVPSQDDAEDEAYLQTAASADTGKVDINTAASEQLMTLPGIGASKAKDIINYREVHGKFSSIEELMNIPGIKEGVFNKLRDLITVD